MESQRGYWSQWAGFLRQWGLHGLAAWMLEAGGPLTLLSAQMLYFGQPFLRANQLDALAHMLEDHDEAQAFAAFLKKEEMAS
jgi:hypothetical protein